MANLILGQYNIMKLLGSGGFGKVFLTSNSEG